MQRPDATLERFVTTFGLGHMRPASGTWGSMPPIVVSGLLVLLGVGPASDLWIVHAAVMVLIVLVFSAATVLGGDGAEATWGKDPAPVVADETAGMALTLLLLPPGLFAHELFFVLTTLYGAFVLFRAFDIAKLPPAGWMQSIAGGWGILLDDLVAALQAGAVAWAVYLLM